MSFDHLGLRPELLRAVAEQGYEQPTPVQERAIPIVLSGRDLLAGAQTGTGKTAAFVLPMLQRLHESRPTGSRRVRALVVTPTRELALQVEESVRIYGTYLPTRSVAIYGGVGMDAQIRGLRAGAEIVVATPGRLLDHHGQGTLRLDGVEILVLDEADRMLDMGFIHDIKKVLALLPRQRQSLLFSATFSPEIRALAERLLISPASVDVAPRNSAAELVTQVVHPVDKLQKRALLSYLIRSRRIEQALVFTRTKHGANRLAEQLQKDGIGALAIHGNKSQGARVRALTAFKDGGTPILVATDIAARGLDIEQLPHVVNYELPNVPEDYVHRIGRTGRAGAGGTAVSLVSSDEAVFLRDIERLLGRSVPREVVTGFQPDPATAAAMAAASVRVATPTRGGGRHAGGETGGRGRGGRQAPAAQGVGRGHAPAQPQAGRGAPRPAAAQPASGGRPASPARTHGGAASAPARGASSGGGRPGGALRSVGIGQAPVAARRDGGGHRGGSRHGGPRHGDTRHGGAPATSAGQAPNRGQAAPAPSQRPSGPRPTNPTVMPGERISARGDRPAAPSRDRRP
ncbi:MAG: DEAD/DEAH box helicase [Chloroflexota bacterium]